MAKKQQLIAHREMQQPNIRASVGGSVKWGEAEKRNRAPGDNAAHEIMWPLSGKCGNNLNEASALLYMRP